MDGSYEEWDITSYDVYDLGGIAIVWKDGIRRTVPLTSVRWFEIEGYG